MKKAKTKTKTVEKATDYAQIAKDLHESFLMKGFNTDQAFQLTFLILSKNLR